MVAFIIGCEAELDKLTYAGNLDNLTLVSGSVRFGFTRGDICDAALLRSVLPGHAPSTSLPPRRMWTGRLRELLSS